MAIDLLKRMIHTHQVDITHNRRIFANAIRHADKVEAEGKATDSAAAPVHQNTDTKPKTGSNPVANSLVTFGLFEFVNLVTTSLSLLFTLPIPR